MSCVVSLSIDYSRCCKNRDSSREIRAVHVTCMVYMQGANDLAHHQSNSLLLSINHLFFILDQVTIVFSRLELSIQDTDAQHVLLPWDHSGLQGVCWCCFMSCTVLWQADAFYCFYHNCFTHWMISRFQEVANATPIILRPVYTTSIFRSDTNCS